MTEEGSAMNTVVVVHSWKKKIEASDEQLLIFWSSNLKTIGFSFPSKLCWKKNILNFIVFR